MGIVGRILNLQCSVCDDSTQTFIGLLHLWGEVEMGVMGTWLSSVCEALQLHHTCLNRESTASCHHSSHGKGESTLCGKAPPQPRVLLRPLLMDFIHPPTPQCIRPSPGRAPIPQVAMCRSWGTPGKHRARRLQHLPVTEQVPEHSSAGAWRCPGCPGSRRSVVGGGKMAAAGRRTPSTAHTMEPLFKAPSNRIETTSFQGAFRPGAATGTGTILQSGRAPVEGASSACLPWIQQCARASRTRASAFVHPQSDFSKLYLRK